MTIAIIGSRNITKIDIKSYISDDITEIVSGGARGVDSLAKQYALESGIKYTEFIPDYSRYKRGAPLKRNEEIANYSDEALIFWDGISKGTEYTIKCFTKLNKKITVVIVKQ